MKKLVFLIALLTLQFAANAQLVSWATATDNSGAAVKTDALGNIYKGGFSKVPALGWSLEKYNSAGNLVWEVHDGGTSAGGVGIYHLALANNGDIYVTTSLRPGSHIGSDSIIVSGIADYALIKYNNQGQLQWYKLLTGLSNGTEAFSSLSVTSTGNLVAQGSYGNTCTFAGQTLSSPGNHIFWGIFAPNGALVSMVNYTAVTAFSWDSELDAADNLVVAAYSNTTNLKTVYKLDLAGNSIWTWEAGTGPGQLYALTLDNTGAAYMTGEFSGPADFDGVIYTPAGGTGSDAYVLKINPNGSFGWFNQLGGTSSENGISIVASSDCEIYLTGYYSVNSDFDGITLASMGGGNDIFFARLDSTGTLRWATQGGGAANDQGSGITHDVYGNRILATGYLGGSVGSTFGGYSFLGGKNGYLVAFSEGACQVTGKVYRDNNNNGTFDVGDQNYPNIMVRVSPGPLWTNSAYTGIYNVYTGLGNFTMDLPNVPAYYVQTGALTHSASFSAFGQVDAGNDFGLYATANINDLRITITAQNVVRANSTGTYFLTYTNVGTTFISGAQVTFSFDTSLTYAYSMPVPDVNSSGFLSWNLPTVYPGDVVVIPVYLDVPLLPIGSQLGFSAEITHAQVEQTPLDNVDSLVQTVVNSYDPNIKLVFPAGDVSPAQVAAGIELDYTIHFQNTGNDTAYFVRLIDTLSANLDLGTFQWVGESHPAVWHIDGNRVLTVDFNNIYLVDSITNEPGSHGFFRYKVLPLASLVHGDQVRNTANIYFDFNPPITTNTTVTQVMDPLSVFAPTGEALLRVYPVPAREILRFSWKSNGNHDAELVLLDTYGRVCGQTELNNLGGSLDVSQLAAGMYLYRVSKQGNVSETGKIVVAR